MLQLLKRYSLVWLLLAGGARGAMGFALLGTNGPTGGDSWQVQAIGYNLTPPMTNYTDIGTPKNLGEGYRWNIPVLYYTYDANFSDYFGSNGIAAVDAAFAVYNSLSNVDSYSSSLSEWPLTATRNKFEAVAVNLLDIKSFTMEMIAEHLGLAQPQRWIYCLHDRFLPGGAVCPNYEYLVIQRNYDPISQVYSQYVNGALYGYAIGENCALNPNPFAPYVSDAIEYLADPARGTAANTSAVADYNLSLGQYFTTLTRDDIGGLRYLYSSNRLNVEVTEPNSLEYYTNTSNEQLISTANLTALTAISLTNNPANLLAIFPNLLIASSTNVFTNLVTTNITAYLYSPPNAPAGTLLVGFTTTYVTNATEVYFYSFANVVTNHVYSNGYVTTSYTNVTVPPGAPAGYTVTNVVNSTTVSQFVNGDYYVIPTNLCGPYQILSTQLVSVILVTNVLGANTGTGGLTNGEGITFDVITYFTNYDLVVFPVVCDTNNAIALRGGVEKVTFVRQDYDSLLSGIWAPVTNYYTLTQVTNNAPVVQSYRRVVTTPDILISAEDLASGPAAGPANTGALRNIFLNNAQALNALAGPGTIQSVTNGTFIFNKVGPVYDAINPFFVSDGNIPLDFLWGSFDGTTNAPIVYPDSVSLAGLLNLVFFQITNTAVSFTNGVVGVPYNVQLGATGGTPPYTWSLPTSGAALPPGLVISGSMISGNPTVAGTYDFTVQATDSGARITQRDFSIEVDP